MIHVYEWKRVELLICWPKGDISNEYIFHQVKTNMHPLFYLHYK